MVAAAALQMASLFNATNAAMDLDRVEFGSRGSDPSAFEAEWALASGTTCAIETPTDPFPSVGDTCTVGDIAWSVAKYCDNTADWLYYCPTGSWTIPTELKNMRGYEDFTSSSKTWVRVDADTTNNAADTGNDATDSWQLGEVSGVASVNSKCQVPEPSGWRLGGSLHVCLSSMSNQGRMSAIICNKDEAGDTPSCADSQMLNAELVDTTDCPVAAP